MPLKARREPEPKPPVIEDKCQFPYYECEEKAVETVHKDGETIRVCQYHYDSAEYSVRCSHCELRILVN